MKSSRLCLWLLVAECVLVIVSWLLSAMRLDGVRSLLSSEGIRWFVGGFSDIVASTPLTWLLLVLIAGGSIQQSGIMRLVTDKSSTSFRDRLALRVACVFVMLYTLVICMLTLMPHAILLSVKGTLFPSAFSRSILPLVCFGVTLFAVVYGMMSGQKKTGEDILDILSYGLRQGAPLIIVYILAIQFYASLRFVFMQLL
ncbi:MAG: AbgT family transporter [Prevotella sp.]|nr:AbgT family transporter [Prevotella sp.]